MGKTLLMSARREITKKHAASHGSAGRKAKGVMLDQVVATTGILEKPITPASNCT